MQLYKDPYPIQARIRHYFRSCQKIALQLNTQSTTIYCKFGKGISLNNPADPYRNDGSAALNCQALGFDKFADTYRTYYVPSSQTVLHFRRRLNKNPESFNGFVGYLYSDGVGADGQYPQNDDIEEVTKLMNWYNYNTDSGLALMDNQKMFFSYPRLVFRRFGINDGEHGMRMVFNYSRDLFLKATAGLDQPPKFENAVGILDGGSVVHPVEQAHIIPFIAVSKETIAPAVTGDYTETAPEMYVETSTVYNTIWRDFRGTHNTAAMTDDVDVRADSNTYNDAVQIES